MYKLLTFNDDYADEHNVPALAVMTIERFNEWLELPSGKLNPNYEEELKDYNAKKDAYEAAHEEIKKLGLWNTPVKDIPAELQERYDELRAVPYIWHYPIRCNSRMRAHLGNGGDGFDTGYQDYYLMKEFIKAGHVSVFDISDETAWALQSAGIEGLSLCNIFEINSDWYDEDDEDVWLEDKEDETTIDPDF